MKMLSKLSHDHLEGFFPVIYLYNRDLICNYFKLDRIMTSVAYLNRRLKQQNIHRILKFDRPIFLDCGIFQRGFYKKVSTPDQICSYRRKLIDWYSHLEPDFASALDLPTPIEVGKDIRKKRLLWSIVNYKFMKDCLDIPLFLGMCIFSKKEVIIAKEQIHEKIGKIPKLLGLGGMVPIVRSIKKEITLGKLILNIIHQVRKEFPHSFIHVYGLGEHRWYPMIRLVGASSSDYAGVYYISGRGGILLPGLSERYFLKIIKLKKDNSHFRYYTRPKERVFSEENLKLLYKCECPVCKTSEPLMLEIDKEKRLIHNMSVVLCENRIVDEYCKENDFEGLRMHVRRRLINKRSRLEKIAKYAVKLSK